LNAPIEFIALNGGPEFKFTEAISLLVDCDTQKEVDELPSALFRLLQDPAPEKSKRVMQAMLQMKMIDIAGLERAYNSK